MTNPNPSPEDLDAVMRAVYDEQPWTVISEAMAKATGLPLRAVIPYDLFKSTGGDDSPLRRTVAVAIAAWNTRTLSPQTLPAPGEVEARKLLDDMVLGHPSFRNEHDKIDGEEYVFVDRAVEAMAAFATPTLATVAAANDEGVAVERYRHVKRGTVYEIVGRAELQVNNIALADGVTMVVYRGEDGKLWVRGEAEFMDGRFEPLATSRSQRVDES